MDHHYNMALCGKVEGYEDKYYYGRRPTGFYIPRFAKFYMIKRLPRAALVTGFSQS